ncbi:SMP-30/gluconolactonase/LRE family protein [Pontibacter fetidus]|uniref:Uncharacterized protein n=1 Tax=Pontibacter fetidus TaxID=2700082 RepID=A0A6B2H8Y4_9BACT|nr:hypothetical protein [Pontibacter fetidus]NDK57596.1 hypothetical protein [Pontibacter fetidus]
MLIKLFTLYVYIQAALCGCGPDKRTSDFERLRKNYKVTIDRVGRMEARMQESSGLARTTDSTFLTNPDGGSPSELYLFNLKGELLQTIPLSVPNTDWEDLAQDPKGNLYLGDFGNNANQRRDLKIYSLNKTSLQVTDTITFNFADQIEFPPPRSRQHYDLEAFLYHNDSLYLFTKSRAFKPITQLYKLPVSGAAHTIVPAEKLRVKSPVTGADVLPGSNLFALLGYGRLYLFKPEDDRISFKAKRYCLPLGRTGQAEAVLFLSPEQLLITNENGKLYLVTFQARAIK